MREHIIALAGGIVAGGIFWLEWFRRRRASRAYRDRMRPLIKDNTPAGMQVDPKDVGR